MEGIKYEALFNSTQHSCSAYGRQLGIPISLYCRIAGVVSAYVGIGIANVSFWTHLIVISSEFSVAGWWRLPAVVWLVLVS